MNKIIVATLAYLSLIVTAAWGQVAVELYNRGLNSSLAYKRIEYFTRAIQSDPNFVEAHEKRAIHYFYQRKYDKAIRDYTRVIELKPLGVESYLMRGRAYLKTAHPQGFRGEFNRLGLRYGIFGEPEPIELIDKAIDDLSRALELNPQLASAYSYRAKGYYLKGMRKEALRDATVAIQLRAEGDRRSTANAYDVRSKVYDEMGQSELSRADFRKSIELAPHSPDFPPLHVPLMIRYLDNIPGLRSVSQFGVFGMIVLALVVIFRLTLRAPKKRD